MSKGPQSFCDATERTVIYGDVPNFTKFNHADRQRGWMGIAILPVRSDSIGDICKNSPVSWPDIVSGD